MTGADPNDLPAMDVAGRLPRLRASLDAAGADALLVTRLVNIRYLTGFTGSAAMLLVRPDDLVFVTDGRYRDQAADQLAAAGVVADIGIGLGERQREIVGAAAAPAARRSRRSSRPAPTARSRTRDRRPDRSCRARWSSSTSAPSSTATAPT